MSNPIQPSPEDFARWQSERQPTSPSLDDFSAWRNQRENPDIPDPLAVKRGQLEVSTKQAHMGNAGEMAEAFVLAQRTKLPVQTVARNLSQVRELAGDKTFEPEQFVRDYPTTADWLTDEANATVSQGDWENLGKMERLLGRWRMPTFEDVAREFGRAGGIQSDGPRGLQAQRGLLQEEYRKGETIIELGELGFLPIDERNRPEVQARIRALQAEQRRELPDRGAIEQFPRGSAEIAPSLVYSLTEGAKGAAIGAGILGTIGAVAGPVGAAAGAASGAAAGAAIGGAIGTWNATAKLEGGNAILAFSELEDEQGNRIDPALADFAGRTVGFFAGSLETIGIGILLKPFGKAVGPLLRGGTAKALQNQTVRRALTKGAAAWAATVGGEVATETAQEGVSLIGEQFARSRSNSLGNTDFGAIPLERVGSELLETAVQTAIGMTLIGVPGGAITTASEMSRVAEAQDARRRLTTLADVAEASELRQRAPEQFRELIQRDVEENGAVRDISIPVERLEVLLQENDVPVDEFVRTVLRDAKPYEQARVTGGDVVIPIADYLARVVGTPLHQAMTEDLRLRPGALTAREAGEMQARIEQDMEAVREEMAAVVESVPDEGQRIVEDVRAKLEATGTYTPEQVATMAPTIAAPYVVLAKRAGLDPWTMYSERNVRVFGGTQSDAIWNTLRALQRAERVGDQEAQVRLRGQLAALREGQSVSDIARAERVRAAQVVNTAVDDAGNLRRKLSDVQTDPLVAQYIEVRDAYSLAAGELAGIESNPAYAAAMESPTVEEANARLEEGFPALRNLGNEADNRKNLDRMLRQLRQTVRRGESGMRRLEAELSKRGVTDVDAYAEERGLLGDDSFDFALEQAAFHGSPYQFDRFDLSKIGTGEGAQAYGWGLYFAESEGVASAYRRTLTPDPFPPNDPRNGISQILAHRSPEEADRLIRTAYANLGDGLDQAIADAKQANSTTGALYRVDLPDAAVARMLDWDKPLSEQAPEVREALALRVVDDSSGGVTRFSLETDIEYGDGNRYRYPIAPEFKSRTEAESAAQSLTGAQVYQFLSRGGPVEMGRLGGQGPSSSPARSVSLWLASIGIPGIKYLDAGSRVPTGALASAKFDLATLERRAALVPQEVSDAELAQARDKVAQLEKMEAQSTRNLVVFDDALVTITHRNGEPVTAQERTDFLAQEAGTEETLTGVAKRREDGEVISIDGFDGGHDAIVISGKAEDGFITSTGRFLDRAEALAFLRARAPQMIQQRAGSNLETRLFSEDVRADDGLTVDEIDDGLTVDEISDYLLQASALPDTIDIDGVQRPTRNSTGQPIHPTEEGVRNFWRWFGDSKVVDAEGRPLVVYHGSDAEFVEFAPEKRGRATGAASARMAFFAAGKRETSLAYVSRTLSEDAFDAIEGARAKIESLINAVRVSPATKQVIWKDRTWLSADDAVEIQSDLVSPSDSDLSGAIGYLEQVQQAVSNIAMDRDTDRETAVNEGNDNLASVLALDVSALEKLEAEIKSVIATVSETDEAEVEAVQGSIRNLYAKIQNPLVVDQRGANYREETYASILSRAEAAGYDGVIIQNTYDGGPLDDIFAAFSNAAFKSADANSGEFGPTANILQQGTGRPNAFYVPGVSQRTIGLLATANLSSALHEFSHDYLFLLRDLATAPDADPSLVADWELTVQTLGITDPANITREQSEQWAESFESYLNRGEAPSRGLLRAFHRFRIWMTTIARELKKQFVDLSPDLAGVFDRMLAVEEELVDARAETAAEPMFRTAEEGGMTDAEFAAYQKAAEYREAVEGASLVKTLLAEQNRDRTAEWKARQAEVTDRVTAEVDADPTYQAINYLRTGTSPDGTKLDTPIRLSKAILVASYGPDVTKSLPRGTFSVEGGIDPDSVALLFGFRDGEALIDALQNAVPRDQKIAAQVTQEMRREFPDLLNDSPALADEARNATHRGETDPFLINELMKLGKMAGTRPVNIPAVKQAARDIIAGTVERDLRPFRFIQAEAKAARLSTEALRKGDVTKAEFHKRQQLLNHVLYREAVKAQESVKVTQRFFARMMKAPAQERLGKAGQIHRNAMNTLLDRYEFRPVSLRQIDRRESLQEYVAEVAGEEYVGIAIPAEVLRDASQRNYRTLTIGELDGIYDAGRQIWHVATTKDKLMREAEQRTLDEQAGDVVAAIAEHHEMTPRTVDYHPLSLDKAKGFLAGVDAWHLAPEFLFRWLDGDAPTGPVWRAFFQPIAEAERLESQRLKEAYQRMQEIEAMLPEANSFAYRFTRLTVPGFRAKVTKSELLAIALNWGSESNREALVASTVDGQPLLGDADTIQAALSQLTAQELAYVQAKWNYINTFWPDIKNLEEAMVGVAPEKIEASPFTVRSADGQVVEMQGGYYPLKYDSRLGVSQSLQQQFVETVAGGTGDVSIGYASGATKHGWTNNRVGSAGKAVDLSLTVFNGHIVNVIHDLTHRRAVRDVARLYARKDVREAIVQTAGQQLYDSIRPWLARVANPNQTFDPSFVEKMFAKARAGTTVVNMGLKATTAVVQIVGLSNSAEYIGPKWMRKGLVSAFTADRKAGVGAGIGGSLGFLVAGPVGAGIGGGIGGWVGGMQAARAKVMAMSTEMENRRTNYNRDVRDIAVGKGGKWSRRDEFFFSFVGMMDMVVSVPTWMGAYQQSFAELSPNNHEDAVAYADSVVRMTQGSGSPKDLSRIQGGPELRKLVTMHYTFFSRLYGQFRRAGTNLQEGRYGVARFAAASAYIWFADAIISEIISGRGPDDDEDWKEWATVEMLRYPLSTVVGLREMAQGIGPDRFDYKLSPAEDALIATGRALNIPYKATLGSWFDEEEEFELSKSDLNAMLQTAGYWGRLPTRQMWITGTYMYDWMMGFEDPETPAEAARNLAFPRRR
jgi:hypothetical protein